MYGVSKITSEQDIMMITFNDVHHQSNYIAEVFEKFAENKVVVDMICQTAPKTTTIDFSFTTEYKYFETVMKTIAGINSAKLATPPMISSGYTKINLFGADMVTCCGVGAKAISALSHAKVDIALITTSDLDISLLIRSEDEDEALTALKAAFEI